MTIRNLVTGKVTHLDVPDEKCDQLLDKFAYEFNLPNPEADKRWEDWQQRKAADALASQQKNRKRR